MTNFRFWYKWQFIVSIIMIAIGLFIALFNNNPIFDYIFNNQVNPVFWETQLIPEESQLFMRWIYGVLGATVAGWGLMTAFLVYYKYQSKEKWVWNTLFWSIVFWFAVDTSITLYYGVTFNVIFNLSLLFAIGFPLLITNKEFK